MVIAMDRSSNIRSQNKDDLSPDTLWILAFADADSVEGSAQQIQLLHSLQAANLKVQEFWLKKPSSNDTQKSFWERLYSCDSAGGTDRTVEYVIVVSGANLRMEEEAERVKLMKKLRGDAGVFPFSRSLRHLFGLRVLQDRLISVNERLCLIHHAMFAPQECNGAALDIASLYDWHLVSMTPLRSATQAQALVDNCCSFWPFKWDSIPLDDIKDFFGVDVATFFLFQQHLTRCSYSLSILSCIVFAFRFELKKAPFSEALWCCIMLTVCSIAITTWRTRLEETMYFWGVSARYANIGCYLKQNELSCDAAVTFTNRDTLLALRRKYFSICVVVFASVAASACICVVVAVAIRNQCTNVSSLEFFDEQRVVSFAFAETVRAIAFRQLFKYPLRALHSWARTASSDMTALPSFSASIVCDVLFFLFHFINLLVIPFYLVFFVAVDPKLAALNQLTFCLDVSISNLIYFVSNLLLLL
jgi:hypothetical protein